MGRFYTGYPWRFIVTDLDLVPTTWASGLLTKRSVTFTRNQSTEISCDLFPDDFRIQGLWTDGYARIAQSNRILWAWRKEDPNGLYIPKAAGIIMVPDDEGDANVPLSHIAAFDPLKLLEARPCVDAGGGFPPRDFPFQEAGPGSITAVTYLGNTILNEGGVLIDAGDGSRGGIYQDWGGTSSYAGTIEVTPDVAITISDGQTVGDLFQMLLDSGNMDVVLKPIYDPNRFRLIGGKTYYYTHELSIYNVAGVDQTNAVMGWDRLNHCISRIDRAHDATPGAFFNKVWYHAGQGGPSVPLLSPLTNPASITDFGVYWSQQFFPALLSPDVTTSTTLALAQMALQLAKQGRRTLSLDLISGRGPIPLIDFNVHDLVHVHASSDLRAAVNGAFQVVSIPIQIDDNGVETVSGMQVNPDYRTVAYPT